MHVEAVVAEVAAGGEVERRLPAVGPDVSEVGRGPVVPGRAIDQLVRLAQLDVVVVVGREDQPPRNGLDEHVEGFGGAVVAAIQPRQDRLVGLARLEHVGQEVGRGFVPVAGRPIDRDAGWGDLTNIGRRRPDGRRAERPEQTDDRKRDPQSSSTVHGRSPRAPRECTVSRPEPGWSTATTPAGRGGASGRRSRRCCPPARWPGRTPRATPRLRPSRRSRSARVAW